MPDVMEWRDRAGVEWRLDENAHRGDHEGEKGKSRMLGCHANPAPTVINLGDVIGQACPYSRLPNQNPITP